MDRNAEKITGVCPDASIIAKQKKEIEAAMETAMKTPVFARETTAYRPTLPEYAHIRAVTYDGMPYLGHKTKVFAYVGFPDGASADSPVPAVLLVHGGGGHPFLPWVKLWNDCGYAAVAMETTGYFPVTVNAGYREGSGQMYTYGLTPEFAEEGYVSSPDRVFYTAYAPIETHWAYHGIGQVILAGNLLRADARVQADKIGICGISWGGVTTSLAIGYDPRFAFAIPIDGTAYECGALSGFADFSDPYVRALWAAEDRLDRAGMPIFWLAYNDDNNFSVDSYTKSAAHTASNPRNALAMLGSWAHSHTSAFSKQALCRAFADYAINRPGAPGFVTFRDWPQGREVLCHAEIPAEATNVRARVFYITEPMTYSVHDKFGFGAYPFLDQVWQTCDDAVFADTATGEVRGRIPDEAAGYYINILFTLPGYGDLQSGTGYIPCR